MKTKIFFAFIGFAILIFASVGFGVGDEPLPTDLPKALVTILSFLIPIVFQPFIKNIKNEMLKYVVVLFLSGVTGVAAIFFSHYPWSLTLGLIERIGFYSSLAYKLIWKPLLFNKVKSLKGIETDYHSESFRRDMSKLLSKE